MYTANLMGQLDIIDNFHHLIAKLSLDDTNSTLFPNIDKLSTLLTGCIHITPVYSQSRYAGILNQ